MIVMATLDTFMIWLTCSGKHKQRLHGHDTNKGRLLRTRGRACCPCWSGQYGRSGTELTLHETANMKTTSNIGVRWLRTHYPTVSYTFFPLIPPQKLIRDKICPIKVLIKDEEFSVRLSLATLVCRVSWLHSGLLATNGISLGSVVIALK